MSITLTPCKSMEGGLTFQGTPGGTGIAGFVMKSGKAGFVSHVYNRYSISLRILIKMLENWGAGSTRKRAQKARIFSGKQV